MQNNKGFTLMELMVTFAIIAIMAVIAIPNFIGWFPRYRLNTGSRDFHDTVQLARIRAIKQNISTAVVFDPGAGTYGLVVLDPVSLVDGDANGVPDGVDNGTAPVLLEEQLPSDVQIAGTTLPTDLILFNARGFPNNGGDITLASASPSAGQRTISLTVAGGINLTNP